MGKDSSMDDKWKAYTDKIGNFVGNNLVKVLIGQRRSGKSYILRQIASSLGAATCRPGFLFDLFTERRFVRIVQLAHCRVRKTIRRFCERYDFVA